MLEREPEATALDRLLWVAAENSDREEQARALDGVCKVEFASPDESLSTRRLPDALLLRVEGAASLDLLGKLARDPKTRAIPILLIGTPDAEDLCLSGLEAGACDFLLEPFAQRVLKLRVSACLRWVRERRESHLRERDLLAEAQMAAEALDRSEERFRTFLRHSPVASWITDEEARVVFLSEPYTRIFGVKREEAVGRSLFEVYPQAFAQTFYDNIRAVAETGGSLQTVEPAPRPDGSVGYFLIHNFPLRDEAGRLLVGGVAADVTEMKRNEEEIERARQEAQAANEAKDQFLATLSHELRTPLTPVLAVLSTLESDPRLESWRSELAMIRRNVELEARLIDDLLDLTRITRGKLELHRRETDARQVVEHALATIDGAIGERGISLGVELQADEHRLWADAPRLTQVFWNLLSNAVKFTPAGGRITVRSWTEVAPSGARELAVEVRDTGIGIEPEVLPRIFDAFEQTGRRITRKFGGLGLGLAVSRAIVDLHGGRLTAASEGKGLGASFTVRLPLGVVQEDLDETGIWFSRPRGAVGAGPSKSVLPEAATARPLAILLVEDHPDTAEAMADLLRLSGHEVTVAGSVAAGIAAAEAGAFDLLLSDLGLPDGSGQDLMRELGRRYDLKGIAISGYGMEEDVRRSREAGFARHLTKPVNRQALEATIRQVVQGG